MSKSISGQKTISPAFLSPALTRRKFMFGALAAGAAGLTACGEGQSVQVASVATPTPSATPSASPLPVMSPLAPKTLAANRANAMAAIDELTNHYAKAFDTPSTLIHGVRAFGRDFQRADGSNAVEYLCSQYAKASEVNGKRYIRFKRFYVEVHENSFLKTFLEAGVSPEQPVLVGGNKYTLRDVGEHAKSLFRMVPSDLDKHEKHESLSQLESHARKIESGQYEKDYAKEHLPWGLIAFSYLLPGGKGSWENAYGEKIDLTEVIDKALLEFETICQPAHDAFKKNEPIPVETFGKKIKEIPCYGGHTLYSLVACVKNGYTDRRIKERVIEQLNLALYRMAKESELIERDYAEAANRPISPNPQEEAMYQQQMQRTGVTKAQIIEMLTLRGVIKLTGHLLEAVNFARLNRLYSPTAEQQKLLQAGEQKLFDAIVKIRALNWEALKNFNAKQTADNVVALAHASRALKLLTPENPDKNPKLL